MPNRAASVVAALLCALALNPVSANERGIASHYGVGDGLQGRITACGRPLNAYALVAASPRYRCGQRLKIVNLGNGASVIVSVVDRGPAAWTGRVIDLSYGAAPALGFAEAGTARVLIIPLR